MSDDRIESALPVAAGLQVTRPEDRDLPVLKSLRAKGMFATLALLAYLVGSAVYIAHERAKVDESIQAMDVLSRHEKALALSDAAVSSALVDANEASSAGQHETGSPSELRLYMESCTRLFAALEEFDPSYALLQRAIGRSYDALVADPTRSNWIDLRESLRRAADAFDIRQRRLAGERDLLIANYQRQFDAVTVESILLAVIGMFAFGSIAALFFARLTRDVQRLERHARLIVHGTRGVALDVRREDELGRLMHAVNRMSADLDEREKQIELDGQRQSHQQKMLAVGALAAGVAHEVNNPLAAILGAAEELRDTARSNPALVAGHVDMILDQVQRASQVARQLADVAAPQPTELDWLDLNELIRRAVRLMGYDRRYRHFQFDVQVDPTLPAARTSGIAIQQLLMQLLSLGCDAIVASPGTPGSVAVTSGTEGDDIVIELTMPPVLDFNQRAVQRSLLLCRAIVEPLRGRLAFDQGSSPQLRIKLTLPSNGGGIG